MVSLSGRAQSQTRRQRDRSNALSRPNPIDLVDHGRYTPSRHLPIRLLPQPEVLLHSQSSVLRAKCPPPPPKPPPQATPPWRPPPRSLSPSVSARPSLPQAGRRAMPRSSSPPLLSYSPPPRRCLMPPLALVASRPEGARTAAPSRRRRSRAPAAPSRPTDSPPTCGTAPWEAVDHFGRPRHHRRRRLPRRSYRSRRRNAHLQALAADTEGFLEVSEEGEVLYVFPKDYRAKLAGKSFRMRVEPALQKAKEIGAYLVRVSFGTGTHCLNCAGVHYHIIAILSSSRGISLFMFLWCSILNSCHKATKMVVVGGGDLMVLLSSFQQICFGKFHVIFVFGRRLLQKASSRKRRRNMNFIESVFSFVFGDGDPNDGLEERRWKMIGQYISSNGGVVTAEELAPFLDVPPPSEEVQGMETLDDESFILPVLLRFQGHPEVDEQGNILYRFPSLQRTASSKGGGSREYVAKANAAEKAMVAGLGGLNLFGVIILGNLLKYINPDSSIPNICWFPFFSQYHYLDGFCSARTNNDIRRRNKAREQRAQELLSPDSSLRRKVRTVEYLSCILQYYSSCLVHEMAQRKVITSEDIVYTTEKDLLDQDYEVKEWERRFKELESE
ncbi:hypothetical protein PR202_ga20809 [Eleusine coracana subsp. coracana]|uniref:Uncharacterized protein n=1 Tax=Eleusine coracana subsp. coracana TaxID=191504 RepID=A0AAV5CZJ6_ELECO|nr:hypothetical protein PR202_ga20809 [Eleusine coracana subsp. coracana]